jgi:hypothetical protein
MTEDLERLDSVVGLCGEVESLISQALSLKEKFGEWMGEWMSE